MLLGFDSRGQPIVSQNPKGQLPALGNGIDYTPGPVKLYHYLKGIKDQVDGVQKEIKSSPLYRIGVDHNINPEISNLMGGLLGGAVQEQVRRGLLDFQVEIPGFNSNRYYFGLTKRF